VQLRQASLAVILLTVFIDMVGIGIVFPIMPKLIETMLGGRIAEASTFYGIVVGVYYLTNFIASPALGALSDRFGRRPIILISLAALGLDYVILALAPNLWWLVVARALSGTFGATITASSAYIADISPPEKRAQNFGLIGAAFGVGFIAGPVIGGLLGEIGPRVPFVVAACLSLVNCLFGLFVLQESLAPQNRRAFSWRDANPVGAFVKVAAYPAVAALMTVAILSNLAERSLESTWVLFSGYRFGWGPFEVGVSLAVVGLLVAIVQGGLIRIVVPWLGEWRTLVVGLVTAAIAFLLYAFATKGWMVYAIMLFHIVGWGCSGPALQALASKAVPANEQGLVQGVLMAIATATGIVGAPVAAGLFGYFVGPDAPFAFPGVSFALGAALFLASLLFLRRPPEDRAVAERAAERAA
jgi:DHA1 family tetracycline resistance protein-like MFS transporter